MSTLSKSFSLESIGLKKSTFDLLIYGKGQEGGKLSIETSFEFVEPANMETSRFDTVLKVLFSLVGLDSDDNIVFTIKSEYDGGFKILNQKEFDKNKENTKQCCFSLIYPIVRDDMLHTLNRAGLRQINLPWSFSHYKPKNDEESETAPVV
jgi:preprotein translocase subunit SecB